MDFICFYDYFIKWAVTAGISIRVASYHTTLKGSRQVERFKTSYSHPLQVLSKMEISNEPIFQHVTWVVKDFLELSQESGYFLDSPEFLFSGDRYCLRLYPDEDIVLLHVRRLSVTFLERKVSCEIGMRQREPDGDERNIYHPKSLGENFFYRRSWVEDKIDEYVPGGNLTLLCKLWLSEVGSSARGEEERGGFPGHSASVSSRWSPTKMELITEFPCIQLHLTCPDVFGLPRGSGDSFTSPEFHFAGDTYCFRSCPNDATADTDLELVRLTSTFTENTVFYRVGYGLSGWPTYPNDSRPLVGSRGVCLSRFKHQEERGKYIWGDTLCLVLFLHLGEGSSAGASTSDVTRERSTFTGIQELQSDFRQVLQKGTVSDACVVVRGKQFRVHRVVLCARSTVFEAMFDHDTAEKNRRVVVDELDPHAFELFLEYLYAGEVRAGLSDDNVFGLYAAADKFDVSALRSECVAHMRRTLSVETFCDVASLALRYGEEDLLQQSIRFLQDNLRRIIMTDKWKQFNVDNGAEANELLIKALGPT